MCSIGTAQAVGADLKVVQDQLGHFTIVVTADTYTSALPETARTVAELTAALLFPARRAQPGVESRFAGGSASSPSQPG